MHRNKLKNLTNVVKVANFKEFSTGLTAEDFALHDVSISVNYHLHYY